MTVPISERLGVYRERNQGVATVLGEAHKLAVKQGMPPTFRSRELSPEPEPVDDTLFTKVRGIVLWDQMVRFSDKSKNQLLLQDFLHYRGHTIESLIKGWDTLFPEGAGHHALKRITRRQLAQVTNISDTSIERIRALYPYEPHAVQQRPETKESIRLSLGGMTRKAREDGYPGVATLLTLAWVVAEQHDSEPVSPDLIKLVQKTVVADQLRKSGLSGTIVGKLVRSDLVYLSDATDLSRISNEQLLKLYSFRELSVTKIRERFPDTSS